MEEPVNDRVRIRSSRNEQGETLQNRHQLHSKTHIQPTLPMNSVDTIKQVIKHVLKNTERNEEPSEQAINQAMNEFHEMNKVPQQWRASPNYK